MAAANSRNGRLPRISRHPAVSRPDGPSPASPLAGRARICSTVSSANTPADTRQVSENEIPVSARPTSGPSRIPAW